MHRRGPAEVVDALLDRAEARRPFESDAGRPQDADALVVDVGQPGAHLRIGLRLLARQADEPERGVVEVHRHLVPLVDGDLLGRVGGDVGLRDGLGHVARDLREPRRPVPTPSGPRARVDDLARHQALGADRDHDAVHGPEVARRHLLVPDAVLGAEDRQLAGRRPTERLHRLVGLVRLDGADDDVVVLPGNRMRRTLTAGTRSEWWPCTPRSWRPLRLMAATCSSSGSTNSTSNPALASCPPTTPPMAPAPSITNRIRTLLSGSGLQSRQNTGRGAPAGRVQSRSAMPAGSRPPCRGRRRRRSGTRARRW